jgi:glutamate-1-semialdehyde 2,1-aminomutase
MIVGTNRMGIDEELYERMAGSAALYERATPVFASGVSHDLRYAEPFPIYIARALGSRKWDVDGNEYVDYSGGHGALILGHGHPAITAAVMDQVARGSHYGACHELEVRWAELVTEIVPSAEKVRFTSSGTEATLMALRLARAFTGRTRVVKMLGHFHGWHDYVTVAMEPPFDRPVSSGVPQHVQDTMTGIPAKDVPALEAELAKGDVAAVLLVCNWMTADYLQMVVDLAHRHRALVIFDEVVTGFRFAPGGAQEHFGVTPDITTLAKILAGGYPGGAVAGRADVMAMFEFRDDPQWMRFGRISHQGTFNGSPVSAAAGIACLEIVRDPSVQRTAAATTAQLAAGIEDVLRRRGVEGGTSSELSLLKVNLPGKLSASKLGMRFQAAMQLGGVDLMGLRLVISAAHGDEDVERTVSAFDMALERLRAEGAI